VLSATGHEPSDTSWYHFLSALDCLEKNLRPIPSAGDALTLLTRFAAYNAEVKEVMEGDCSDWEAATGEPCGQYLMKSQVLALEAWLWDRYARQRHLAGSRHLPTSFSDFLDWEAAFGVGNGERRAYHLSKKEWRKLEGLWGSNNEPPPKMSVWRQFGLPPEVTDLTANKLTGAAFTYSAKPPKSPEHDEPWPKNPPPNWAANYYGRRWFGPGTSDKPLTISVDRARENNARSVLATEDCALGRLSGFDAIIMAAILWDAKIRPAAGYYGPEGGVWGPETAPYTKRSVYLPEKDEPRLRDADSDDDGFLDIGFFGRSIFWLQTHERPTGDDKPIITGKFRLGRPREYWKTYNDTRGRLGKDYRPPPTTPRVGEWWRPWTLLRREGWALYWDRHLFAVLEGQQWPPTNKGARPRRRGARYTIDLKWVDLNPPPAEITDRWEPPPVPGAWEPGSSPAAEPVLYNAYLRATRLASSKPVGGDAFFARGCVLIGRFNMWAGRLRSPYFPFGLEGADRVRLWGRGGWTEPAPDSRAGRSPWASARSPLAAAEAPLIPSALPQPGLQIVSH